MIIKSCIKKIKFKIIFKIIILLMLSIMCFSNKIWARYYEKIEYVEVKGIISGIEK